MFLDFCSCLRVEEVTKVKVEDINSIEHKLRVIGKGNKERYTILPDITIGFLRQYCKEKKHKRGIFISRNKQQRCNESKINNKLFEKMCLKG